MSYTIKSPLPGTVLDIKVAEGSAVQAGECVLVLEAMKMENEIPTDFAGTVSKVLVDKGAIVNSGDDLIEIE